MIMITHDMGIVAETCDRVAVMYAGDIVEEADVTSIFDYPRHPYTIGLLKAIPKLVDNDEHRLEMIPGVVPNLINIGPGCRFHERCPYAIAQCTIEKPPRIKLKVDHLVACHRVYDIHSDLQES